jgi:hypothetical protein
VLSLEFGYVANNTFGMFKVALAGYSTEAG